MAKWAFTMPQEHRQQSWGGHQEGASRLCARSYFALTSITDHYMNLLLLLVHAIDCLCSEYFLAWFPTSWFQQSQGGDFCINKTRCFPPPAYCTRCSPACLAWQIFNRQPMGEHTSNTAVQLMMHPVANKPMLLCGQTLGFLGDRNLSGFLQRRMEQHQNHEEMMVTIGNFFYRFIYS